MDNVKFMPAGDQAMVVEFGNKIDEAVNHQVLALASAAEAGQLPGITETVPTFRSLLIGYDPEVTDYRSLERSVRALDLTGGAAAAARRRILQIPCCYGARFGLDFAELEAHTGLDRDEIIAIHSGTDYKIYMMGFLPGFVYLGGMDPRIAMPRLEVPRLKILPGAVGIAGSETGVYPLASPGGWHLIGGTPVDFYDPDRAQPILCRAGEYIHFVPIGIGEYYDIRHEVMQGSYQVRIVEEGDRSGS